MTSQLQRPFLFIDHVVQNLCTKERKEGVWCTLALSLATSCDWYTHLIRLTVSMNSVTFLYWPKFPDFHFFLLLILFVFIGLRLPLYLYWPLSTAQSQLFRLFNDSFVNKSIYWNIPASFLPFPASCSRCLHRTDDVRRRSWNIPTKWGLLLHFGRVDICKRSNLRETIPVLLI